MAQMLQYQGTHRCMMLPLRLSSPFTSAARVQQRSISSRVKPCVTKASKASSRQSRGQRRQAASHDVSQAHSADSSPQAEDSKMEVKQATATSVSADGTLGEVKPVSAKVGTLWGLLVLAGAYVHHSTCGSVPELWFSNSPHYVYSLNACRGQCDSLWHATVAIID